LSIVLITAKTTTAPPILICPDSAPLNAVEAMSASSTAFSSVNSSGIFSIFHWA
jgi:hypothetical protein